MSKTKNLNYSEVHTKALAALPLHMQHTIFTHESLYRLASLTTYVTRISEYAELHELRISNSRPELWNRNSRSARQSVTTTPAHVWGLPWHASRQ